MFVRFSKDDASELKIQVDNCFITDYLPYAPETYVKVYLYGLSLALSGNSDGNTAEEISKKLSLDANIVMDAFNYWAQQGIVNVLSTTPAAVEYLAVNKPNTSLRKFSKTKYKDFNDQLHAMLPGRNILPNEYNEYYNLMENTHLEPNAMLAIIAYCIRQKGDDINYPYILAVARNLAGQNYITYDRVSEKLSEYDLYDKDLTSVLKSLGLKRGASIDDKRMFDKWTKTLGFKLEVIIHVAKNIKKGGMDKLDQKLTKYYESRLLTSDEIDNFEGERDRLYALTKDINKIIGVYYEQLDFIIETYITKWLSYGFSDEALLIIADYCFKKAIRTLEGMDSTVEKFYQRGLLSLDSINGFMHEAAERDKEIKAVFEKAGMDRIITARDRDAYRTWTFSWKITPELINYAAELSKGTSSPMVYMNGILSKWLNGGVKTLDAAKNFGGYGKPSDKQQTEKSYTSEQLNSMFDHLLDEL